MEVQVADSGPCRKTLTIRIPPDRVRAHLDEMYATAARQVRIDGFRPGKVPRKVLEKKFGEAILAEAKESLVNRSFEAAMRDNDLAMIGRPRLEGIDATPLDARSPLEFQVHVDVRPKIELGKVRGLEIRAESTVVTDEDLDGALQQLAGRKRAMRAVDEPAADGDFIKADAVYRCDGQEVHHQEGMRLNTTIPIAGTDPETFAAKLRGVNKGESRTIELTFADGFEVESVRGKKGEVELRVVEVQRVVAPPIDDAFAKEFDFDDLESMRTDLRARIAEEKASAEKTRQESRCIELLLDQHPFELPEGLIDDEAKARLDELAGRMREAGVAEDEIEQKVEQSRDEARADAERRVRVFFLLDAIAKDQKLFVTEGEIEEALKSIAAQNEATLQQARDHMEKHNLMGDLRLSILERKVRDFLRDNAKITDS